MSEGPPTSGSGAAPGAEPAQPAVPAGWYPHPTAPGWEAYWTGTGWGTETRPAQAAAPAPEAPAEPQAQPEAEPATGAAAATAGVAATSAGVAAQAQPAQQVPAEEASTQGGTPDQAAATPAAAAAPSERSKSSLPVVLCVLGAIVAIVGSFLPLASSNFDGFDFVDNTLVGQSLGIAVIAVAVLGAVLAVWTYLKGNRTWLVVLAGVVILAIAAYMGLVGIDDLSPDIPASSGGDVQISGDLSEVIDPDATPSTGIFAVAVGGLLMALGGIGLARESR